MLNAIVAALCLGATITGPSEIATPAPVIFTISGLPALEQDRPLREQLDWFPDYRIIVSAPDEAATSLRQRLFIEMIGGEPGWIMEVTLTPSEPGVYVLIGPEYAHHRLVVGGTSPELNPHQAVILLESKTQTMEQAVMTNQLRNDPGWSKKILILDPDQETTAGQLDPQVQQLLGRGPPPRVYLLDEHGAIVVDFSLPPDSSWNALRDSLNQRGLHP